MDAEMDISQLPENEQFSSEDIAADVLARFQNSPQEEHRNICAIVGAISLALKEQGLALTPVTYFAAAVSSFIRLIGDPSTAGGDPDVSAIICFLSFVLPRVPSTVLKNKGGIFSESLAQVLGYRSLPVDGVIAALKCISHLLVISDKSNSSSMSQLYGILLNYVTDNNSKVRKQSYACLHDVLQSFQGSTILLLASEGITSALERFLLLCGSNPPNSVAVEESKGAREVLYILNALKDCIDLISIKSTNIILKYCKYLLDMRQLSVTRSIMEILQTLCSRQASNFSPEFLLELLCSLAHFIPEKEKSADGLASVARLLNLGTKRVFSLNRNMCVVKLPIIFNSLGEILAGEHEEAIFAATEALKSLIYSCLDENLIKQGIEQINLNHGGGLRKSGPTIIEKICAIIEGFLDFRYNAVWDVVFQVISAAFDQLGRHSAELMAEIMRNLADIQSYPDDEFSYKKQLHECLGSALAAMGPEKFLCLLPLNLDAEDVTDWNVWVLPILKQYTVGAELHFFSQYILDMVSLLKQKSLKLERDGRIFSARNVEGLIYSLWSLFPSFCNYPVDANTSFKEIQDILCNTLRQESELHGIICSGLQILIQQNKSASQERFDMSDEVLSFPVRKAKEMYTANFARENLNILGSSSKFLSVLSEVFLEAPNDSGGCLQSTIHLFASISDRATVKKIFRKNMIELLKVTKQVIKLKESKESSSMQVDNLPDEASLTRARALRLELAAMLVSGLDEEEIDLLFSATKPALQDEEGLMQKKAYKILSLILKESNGFLSNKLDELLQLIITATASCHFSAKRHRLDCLYYVIVHISKETSSEQKTREFLSAFLTEILLSLKETNKKTRNKAYDLLVEIGHACRDEKRGGKTENLHQLFSMVAGGLISERPHMVSAAIKGLARLAYEFSDLLSSAYKLLPSSFLLLQRKNREIIKANLGLIKVLVAKSKADGLETHLKGIVEGLLKWRDETKSQFKAKIKSLIEMLVSKCGVDAVKAVMPEEHLKLLKNIRKIKERKERKTKSQEDVNSLYSRTSVSRHSRWNHTRIFSDLGDEDGGEGSDIENGVARRRTSFHASRASLRSSRMRKLFKKSLPEDLLDQSDDDPLDLLDRRTTRSILLSTSKPNRKVEDCDDEPEMDNDGRLIVHDDCVKPKLQKNSSDSVSDTRSLTSSRISRKSLLSSHRKRQKTESGWSYTGVEYTSKKAGGDLKKKGKLEPYAYWPLDRKLLNRRVDRKAVARKGMASVMVRKDLKKLEGKSASKALAGTPKRKRGKK
ncbi:hypothetical protein KFK09_020179 [Dendrobium nobile]|uniref:RRP12-like protein n=1 Tax=Dendrobium nobile TaxID=94219 RepID=A0A8T3ARL5_DENNO|nr:hypothetical protein KFK09_020179 [Dendrobium nobile]